MIKPNDWVVVLDDSDCTVKLGGPGYMWKVVNPINEIYFYLDGVPSPYSKHIFRKATKAEIIYKILFKDFRANLF